MKKTIRTEAAPQAIGPYSQAVLAGDLLFISGQLAIDPSGGKLIDGGINAQTERILHNLQAIAEAGGAQLANVVKTTIFLTDMSDFAEVNKVYGSFFPAAPPARSTVQVAALPLNARIEIEAIVSLA